MNKSTLEDHLAKSNLEGGRTIWASHKFKFDYIFNILQKYFIDKKSILDIGVGDGYWLKLCNKKGLKCTGIDISEYLVNILNNKYSEIEFINFNISQYSTDKKYDIISSLDCLEHIHPNEINNALKNISKMLSDKGIFIGTLPIGENLENAKVFCPKCEHSFHPVGHYHSFENRGEIINFLGKNFQFLYYKEIPFNIFNKSIINIIAFYFFKKFRFLLKKKVITTILFVGRWN